SFTPYQSSSSLSNCPLIIQRNRQLSEFNGRFCAERHLFHHHSSSHFAHRLHFRRCLCHFRHRNLELADLDRLLRSYVLPNDATVDAPIHLSIYSCKNALGILFSLCSGSRRDQVYETFLR
ncbi:hypothetical protein PFISCL1PPCAC_14173, partial [Pristionchus fissidentatus]